MKESDCSWNIEDLVIQMEKMQAENEELNKTISQKDEQIQQLSSEISDLQSTLLTLKKELQTKSDQIVKMKSADLILKENEQLKGKDKLRENELSEIKIKTAAEIQACKNEYNTYRIRLGQEHSEKYKKLQSEYTVQNESLSGQLFCWFFYASIVTLLTAIRSDTFVHDLKAFIEGLGNAVITYFTMITDAGESAAGICTHIGNPIVQDILYLIVASLVGISLIAITGLIAYFPIKEYVSWYKQRICDHISLWVAVITLAFTIFFAEDIKDIISVNLIALNFIIHIIYMGIRVYLKTSK